jgi:hypothetical protein
MITVETPYWWAVATIDETLPPLELESSQIHIARPFSGSLPGGVGGGVVTGVVVVVVVVRPPPPVGPDCAVATAAPSSAPISDASREKRIRATTVAQNTAATCKLLFFLVLT